jgi:hypothetical protein
MIRITERQSDCSGEVPSARRNVRSIGVVPPEAGLVSKKSYRHLLLLRSQTVNPTLN